MIPTLSGRSEMDKPGAVQEARSSEGSATGRQLSIAFEAAPLHGISSPDRGTAAALLATRASELTTMSGIAAIVFMVLFAFQFLGTVAYLFLIARLFKRLKASHTPVWEALGSPSLFLNN